MSSSGAGFYIGVPVSPTTERERQGLEAKYEARGLPLDAQPDADEQDGGTLDGGTLDGGAQDGSHA
ncbi:MAG: hypothetical protein L0G70_11975 [Rubrobacter sp.]|nr:hypothetical protein [Rubrobacter sp.]